MDAMGNLALFVVGLLITIPAAFIEMLRGENFGKRVIRVGDS